MKIVQIQLLKVERRQVLFRFSHCVQLPPKYTIHVIDFIPIKTSDTFKLLFTSTQHVFMLLYAIWAHDLMKFGAPKTDRDSQLQTENAECTLCTRVKTFI